MFSLDNLQSSGKERKRIGRGPAEGQNGEDAHAGMKVRQNDQSDPPHEGKSIDERDSEKHKSQDSH